MSDEENMRTSEYPDEQSIEPCVSRRERPNMMGYKLATSNIKVSKGIHLQPQILKLAGASQIAVQTGDPLGRKEKG
eukprot:6195247-Pleurochrysis_carterae.AAC.2